MNEIIMERAERINQILGERKSGVNIRYNQCFKNEKLKDAYIISKTGSDIAPVLYYSAEWWDLDDQALTDYIIDICSDELPELDRNAFFNPGYVQANIMPRLTSNTNLEAVRAENMAFMEICDMIAIMYLPLPGLNMAMHVTGAFLESIGMSVEEAFEYARKNISEESEISDLGDVLRGFGLVNMPHEECSMIVVTNHAKEYGAAAILSNTVLQAIKERLGCNFLILPSSIHEVICVPMDKSTDDTFSEMLAIVKHINETEVRPEEVLANNVYTWDGRHLHAAA